MTWTQTPPTEPGWYWYFDGNVCAPIPCCVKKITDPQYAKPWVEALHFAESGESATWTEPEELDHAWWLQMQHVPDFPPGQERD